MPKKTKQTNQPTFVFDGNVIEFPSGEIPPNSMEETVPTVSTERVENIQELVENEKKADNADTSLHDTKSRIRTFSLSTYIDDIPSLDTFLRRAPWIAHYAYCRHDRDKYADGTPKPTHTHILIYTHNAHTVSAVRKRFNVLARSLDADNPQNTLGKGLKDAVHMWRYLRHLDNPDKAQYEENERICDDYSYWYKLEKTSGMNDHSDNIGLAILTDYLNGLHPLEMAQRWGKEYIYHLTHYQKVAYEIYKYDALTNVNELGARDIMRLCLDGSPLSKDQILVFWNVYDYIISQLHCKYNSNFQIYLTDNEKKSSSFIN